MTDKKKSVVRKKNKLKDKLTQSSNSMANMSVQPIVNATPEKTLAEKIWDHIKFVELHMFGLPNQTISKYCIPVLIDPNKLYLDCKVGLVLPTMEEILKNKYRVERIEKYIVVSPLKGLPNV